MPVRDQLLKPHGWRSRGPAGVCRFGLLLCALGHDLSCGGRRIIRLDDRVTFSARGRVSALSAVLNRPRFQKRPYFKALGLVERGGDRLGGREPRAGVRDQADPGENLVRLDDEVVAAVDPLHPIAEAASMRVCRRSGGSNTCESDKRIRGSVAISFAAWR